MKKINHGVPDPCAHGAKLKCPPGFCRRLLTVLVFIVSLTPLALGQNQALTQGQTLNVSGRVTESSGDPIPGVNVFMKGQPQSGTITDVDGGYLLNGVPAKATLVFSFIGFEQREVPVEGRAVLDVMLQEEVLGLHEVVVIGYGTQRKGDVTSAIASVKSEDFLSGNTQSAADLIKGKVPGLVITRGSGDPNAGSSINLRGMVSLEGNSAPLVLVDGIPGNLSTVAPENIASVDVLRDASAAAIYGTRGAAGVILITTKTGNRERKPVVTYAGYYTTSDFYKTADFMTPADIRAGKTTFTDLGSETDWLEAISQTAFTQNHSLSFTGGTGDATYAANVTYREQAGKIRSTGNNELKMSLDLSQYFLDELLKVNVNLVKGLHEHDIADPAYAYRQAVIRNPTLPVYDADGGYNEDFSVLQYYNPVAILNEKTGNNSSEWTRMTGNLTVKPITGWETNLMLATRRSFSNDASYTSADFYTANTNNRIGEAYRYAYEGKSDNLELTSRYNFSKGDHRFNTLAGYSYEASEGQSFWASNYGFPTDYFLYNNLSAGSALNEGKAGMGSSKNEEKLIGFFGRVSYGYADRYNALVSVRYEGSSKFGENHKWGTFPSLSLSWNISNEGFMAGFSQLSLLKIRSGYGVTGVIPNNPYQSLTRYSYASGNYYDGTDWKKGLGPVSNPNPDLKWEVSSEYNTGLDFGFAGDRISGSVDYYHKTTTDMLYWYNVPVPPNLYGSTLANVGEMRNQGVEAILTVVPVRRALWEWSSSVTLSHNKNKLISLSNDLYETENYLLTAWAGDPISLPTHRVEIGMSMGQFWGMKSVGLSEDGFWLIEDPVTGEAVVFNDDVKSNEDYRQFLGSGLPKINLGWNNTFRYGKWDLVMQMSGQFGHKILNNQRMFYENNSIAYNRLRSAADDVYGVAPLSRSLTQTFVSYYLEDGDYLKMDNLTLGYTFKGISFASELRLYATGENLFCLTDYSGPNPELNTDFRAAGTDNRDQYPAIRSFTLGLNLTF